MKRVRKKGKLDYSELNDLPEKHERVTARYFVDRGMDVKFLRPSSVKGTRNPDFLMAGKIWEIKSPIVYSDSSFEYNFKKAMKQSKNIIFDLRRLNIRDEKKYMKELRKWSIKPLLKILLVITRDGRLLTLRGKFDII